MRTGPIRRTLIPFREPTHGKSVILFIRAKKNRRPCIALRRKRIPAFQRKKQQHKYAGTAWMAMPARCIFLCVPSFHGNIPAASDGTIDARGYPAASSRNANTR